MSLLTLAGQALTPVPVHSSQLVGNLGHHAEQHAEVTTHEPRQGIAPLESECQEHTGSDVPRPSPGAADATTVCGITRLRGPQERARDNEPSVRKVYPRGKYPSAA